MGEQLRPNCGDPGDVPDEQSLSLMHGSIAPEATALKIWLLGGFRVVVGGRSIAADQWRRKKVSYLVKLLALAGGRLSREQLLDALWPDLSPEAAANNLYQTLHTTRHLLGTTEQSARQYLQIRSDVVHLVRDGNAWTDVAAFAEAAKVARASQAEADYRAALALYGGDLLPDDVTEEWTRDRRVALRQEYVALLLGLAQREEAGHQIEAAVATLLRLMKLDPGHEEGNARLMRLYARSGQRQLALRQYRSLVEHLRAELGTEPDARIRRLYHAILEGRVIKRDQDSESGAGSERQAKSPHNLPTQLTRFIGREYALGEVRRFMSRERLLTLTGPGGCGKTRLAIEAGQQLIDLAPDGVWFVELAALTDPRSVPGAVATVLGIQESADRPVLDALVVYLRSRQVILIVDNCEHLIEACADLANTVLRACPALRILATSREPLGIAGEITWVVPSLSLANPKERLPLDGFMRSEAIQLFVDRATAAQPSFRVTESNAVAISQICYRLDGIPLAIELAAARVAAFGVEQIARRLDESFRLLTAGHRTGLARQQTLRATLDWSHDLLTDAERVFLRRLSVFAGGFSIEAAEAVCAEDGSRFWVLGASPPSAPKSGTASPFQPPGTQHREPGTQNPEPLRRDDVLDLLFRLVNRSLVIVEDRDGVVRYRLLEMVRQYAAERLEESGEVAWLRERHLVFFVALAEEAEPRLTSANRGPWLARLAAEHDNLRAALAFGLADSRAAGLGLRLVGALTWYWNMKRLFVEGREWAERLLVANGPQAAARARAKALHALARLGRSQGDYAVARPSISESLAISRSLGDDASTAAALHLLGIMVLDQHGDVGGARAAIQECVDIYRRIGDAWGLALALYSLGDTFATESAVRARAVYFESVELCRELGDSWGMAFALTSLGRISLDEGDLVSARGFFEEGLAARRASGDRWLVAISLNSLALVERGEGNWEQATALCDEALTIAREVGSKSTIAWSLFNLGSVMSALGESDRATAYFAESLILEAALERPAGVARILAGFAGVAADQGQHERAARLLGAVRGVVGANGQCLEPIEQTRYEQCIAATRNALGSAAFDRAWVQGRDLEFSAAVAYALAP